MNKRLSRVLLHIGGWILLYLLPPLAMQSELRLPQDFGDFMWWAIVIICFYINYLWLVPKILIKRKFGQYFTFILLMLVFTYTANEFYIRQVHRQERNRRGISEQRDDQPKRRWPRFRSYNSALFCFAVLALGTSIKVTESWYENEKQRKEMENQKLGAELSLLKSQINPHFFFNTLNSIYSLAIIKSDKTPEAVIKLSEIMRYIIYDTERTVVPLSKEVEYIANYIELQRLRLTKQVHVDFTTKIGSEDSVIEPLLLLPFIENAFKHGIDNETGGVITVSIVQEGNMLRLHVENPLLETGMRKIGPSGLGMSNTLKRLKLLYHDNYKLSAGPVAKSYVIDLVLKLKEDGLSDS
jgi:sensor histidine kinase YesM